MTNRVIPDDFPREPGHGVVSGAQPKLVLRRIDGRYYAGLTEDELWERYDACEDLAQQLAGYAARKMSEHVCPLDDVLTRVEKSVANKVSTGRWDLSSAEIAWTMKRTRELLTNQAKGEGGGR
ncbi:hypothetical protein [Cupriavidus numazuensis]|uniref:Uncharacterized protein n=1 Tax=Cupriavidus numazuensis TaxID=221992 RepID=A0ABM8TSR7_9BURK|nr:hypothetical protein [Cupriavidus numazuensis]CAG2159417.1 hypothetical protein LMG26411_06690 [Cupriavidus numazuensis]